MSNALKIKNLVRNKPSLLLCAFLMIVSLYVSPLRFLLGIHSGFQRLYVYFLMLQNTYQDVLDHDLSNIQAQTSILHNSMQKIITFLYSLYALVKRLLGRSSTRILATCAFACSMASHICNILFPLLPLGFVFHVIYDLSVCVWIAHRIGQRCLSAENIQSLSVDEKWSLTLTALTSVFIITQLAAYMFPMHASLSVLWTWGCVLVLTPGYFLHLGAWMSEVLRRFDIHIAVGKPRRLHADPECSANLMKTAAHCSSPRKTPLCYRKPGSLYRRA